MHVGTTVIFQGQGEGRTDREVYRNDLHLGDLAEPLGFDSLWGVEHHFTNYTMCPDVLQYLTYFAGRTQRIRLGSMVVVLPWHHPLRVAEQVSMLDHMSNGRVILGIGRGVARVEFGGFGLDQNNSRDQFVEFGQMILQGLERGYCEFDGKMIKQERRNIRPAPFKSFRGRSYAAAVSPESMPIMAKLGVGLLIIPQKPWDRVIADLDTYNRTYREANGAEPPPPLLAGWIFCDHDADQARERARKYIGAYYQSILQHYELLDDYLGKLRGYESYKVVGKNNVTPDLIDKMTDFFLNLQIFGTPEQCYNRILEFKKNTGAEAFTAVFSYGGMPYDVAERNMRMFAREVMPELKKVVPVEQQVIARSAVAAEATA
jgi:alkanesulfonate monooxygenase SsuD/methylene tetrahydromethanopterin reductase-like flavin-dependent oxidoreductase (luciferase family)